MRFDLLIPIFRTFNEILTAGIAITAFSLLLYALSFNLRDRVARSFAIILVCVMIVFTGEALGSTATSPFLIEFWLRFQWVGIGIIPAAYLHFSDALMETTGRPSRGRRRFIVRLSYLVSFCFLFTLPFPYLVGPLVIDGQPAPHLQRTWLTWLFSLFYISSVAFAVVNFWRAYKRTVSSTSRRRMQYLMAGGLAPALGSYPYLLFGSQFASGHPLLFWLTALLSNLLVTVLLVIMAYAVAFFGVPWPDRVVKRRLFKWLMRGPVTASSVLAITTVVKRVEQSLGYADSAIVPVTMVAVFLLMEHVITLIAPFWERFLFYSGDEADLRLLQSVEERLLTTKDLRQFLEAILAAVCDQIQVSTAFLASLREQGLEFLVTVGDHKAVPNDDLSQEMLDQITAGLVEESIITWGSFWLIPLRDDTSGSLLGLMGVKRRPNQPLDEVEQDALKELGHRAAMALIDRLLQQQVFTSLKDLTPQMEMIQRLTAASRYDRGGVLSNLDPLPSSKDLARSVKGALSHYWGGPKLTESPLLRLRIVQQALSENDGNPVNSLRSILRQAIERVRPAGERRFTAEWILYNILEMKFMQGRKVRDVAMRLSMSEADLYRKQRVAIEAVAKAISDMEARATEEVDVVEQPGDQILV